MSRWFSWWTLFFAGFWLLMAGGAVAILIGGSALDRAEAYLAGERGTVAPLAGCRWVEEHKARDSGWECHGVFTGGGLRVDNVRIEPHLAEKPGFRVPAIVSGPDAEVAWTTDDWTMVIPAIAALVFAAIPTFVTVSVFREGIRGFLRSRRRGRGRREIARELREVRRELREVRRLVQQPATTERELRELRQLTRRPGAPAGDSRPVSDPEREARPVSGLERGSRPVGGLERDSRPVSRPPGATEPESPRDRPGNA
ncbi:hypothetical protein [Actinoplanes palleronii]|uniref:DUF3592 domain-containing protein n=1 Tax=Actinoplanes palleronii TaxID=113570 RepID=A0ABQ4BMA7_9ACTN|nr:hypothetical protein [Actinoplanes palleronii]GIE71796.1 hypothetical protein Apa02nite_079040 [Actinoplanes palleronii]